MSISRVIDNGFLTVLHTYSSLSRSICKFHEIHREKSSWKFTSLHSTYWSVNGSYAAESVPLCPRRVLVHFQLTKFLPCRSRWWVSVCMAGRLAEMGQSIIDVVRRRRLEWRRRPLAGPKRIILVHSVHGGGDPRSWSSGRGWLDVSNVAIHLHWTRKNTATWSYR